MNKLTQTLLGSSALCALTAASVMAQPTHPAMHVMALHAGHAVNKTTLHIPAKHYVTYTFGIYTSASASSVDQDLYGTFYQWCSAPNGYCEDCRTAKKQKVKTPKKTVYGSTKADTETYSFGCTNPTVLYGDAWTNETGVPGDVDTFRSSLIGHFMGPSHNYKGTLNLDVQVTITQ